MYGCRSSACRHCSMYINVKPLLNTESKRRGWMKLAVLQQRKSLILAYTLCTVDGFHSEALKHCCVGNKALNQDFLSLNLWTTLQHCGLHTAACLCHTLSLATNPSRSSVNRSRAAVISRMDALALLNLEDSSAA